MQTFDLWEFSLWVYHRPGVVAACLRLQERYGADVNILLFALWLGQCGETLSSALLRQLTTRACEWHDMVVRPLRRVCRALKPSTFPVQETTLEGFRETLKSHEIDAEKLEQLMLFLAASETFDRELSLITSSLARERAGRRNVETYCRQIGATLDDEDATDLDEVCQAASRFEKGSAA